jgi:hypothetical protein
MNLTYYYCDKSGEIEAILRDGFTDTVTNTSNGIRGVYLAEAPGEPDPEYLDDQLLEITLSSQVDISHFELIAPNATWREWVVPACILNRYGRVRPLRDDQWKEAWTKWRAQMVTKALEELVKLGFLEPAKDSEGQLMYRNGQRVLRITKKGIESKEWLA